MKLTFFLCSCLEIKNFTSKISLINKENFLNRDPFFLIYSSFMKLREIKFLMYIHKDLSYKMIYISYTFIMYIFVQLTKTSVPILLSKYCMYTYYTYYIQNNEETKITSVKFLLYTYYLSLWFIRKMSHKEIK